MASNVLPAREIVCVSLHKDKRTILAPYAFELAGNETFSQLLESLYIASVKDKLNTRFSEPITISDKTLVKCYIFNTSNGDKIEVSTALKTDKGVKKFRSFITFELSDKI